ncbi:F0F1 ATP synthase subunit B [uncultured Sphingomonas sp.]|uniref:F0F1 ATP synthase subunit B family protein n=1 Tax=uncultured Sphingomonas sp. TaxID=158754 RepID=UPI0025F41B07|nr:F0F1 ATP synthase subunit B [uncultured Sphingomonas sp.]
MANAETAPTFNEAIHEEGVPKTGGEALTVEHGGTGPANHPDPALFGLDATVWVSLAMAVFLAVLVVKGVPKLIGGMLDKQIAGIRQRLEEAKQLRAEAEALRDEYARKLADVETQTRDIVAHAEDEAKALVAKAEADAADLVARRAKMAEDKIAAAERSALAEVRAKTADAATKAAASLIAAKHGVDTDQALIDRTIAGLGRLN